MPSVFETKKIDRETLGDYLESVRESLGLSVEEVAHSVGMSDRFLYDLEAGNFSRLPADVYVVGFLKRIAVVYSIEADGLIGQYKREKNILQKNMVAGKKVGSTLKSVIGQLEITPKLLTIVFGIGFVVATVIYVIWQVMSINRNPNLEIYEPKHRQLIRQSTIEVSGKTDPGMTVTINDQPVFVDTDGRFGTQLSAASGPNDLVFMARNKFDKTVTKVVSIVVEQSREVEYRVNIRLELTDATEISYRIDEGEEKTELVQAGNAIDLAGKDLIEVSTENAGTTRVILNGQDMGFMGKPGETLKSIPFSAEPVNINNIDI